MKELIRYVGIICTVVVIELLTGMNNQPWWFQFVYTFPMIRLLIVTTKKRIKVMTQYINKGALVAEIERLKCNLCPDFYEYNYDAAKVELLEKIENFIDTLEVKEVDLEKELRDFVVGDIDDYDMGLAKHFYELGLKAAQKGE